MTRGRRSLLRPVLAAVVLVALVAAVVDQGAAVRGSLREVSLATLAAGFGCGLLALAASMQAWRVLLADLGSPLPLRAAARVFYLGQVAKYVPGSLWSVMAQVELGRDYGVPRRQSGTASVLLFPLGVVSAGLVAAAALPFASAAGARRYAWAFLAIPLALAVLHPRVLRPLLDRALALVRRGPVDGVTSGPGTALAVAWSVAAVVAYGGQLFLLARALDADAATGRLLALSVGGFALAWLAGFLVVVAPAGAGVREAALLAVFSGVLPAGAPLVLALVSRLLVTLADVLAAAVAAWVGRHVRREAVVAVVPGPPA